MQSKNNGETFLEPDTCAIVSLWSPNIQRGYDYALQYTGLNCLQSVNGISILLLAMRLLSVKTPSDASASTPSIGTRINKWGIQYSNSCLQWILQFARKVCKREGYVWQQNCGDGCFSVKAKRSNILVSELRDFTCTFPLVTHTPLQIERISRQLPNCRTLFSGEAVFRIQRSQDTKLNATNFTVCRFFSVKGVLTRRRYLLGVLFAHIIFFVLFLGITLDVG